MPSILPFVAFLFGQCALLRYRSIMQLLHSGKLLKIITQRGVLQLQAVIGVNFLDSPDSRSTFCVELGNQNSCLLDTVAVLDECTKFQEQ